MGCGRLEVLNLDNSSSMQVKEKAITKQRVDANLQGRAYSSLVHPVKASEVHRSWVKTVQESLNSSVSYVKKTYESISSEEAKFGTGFGLGLGLGGISSIYQYTASSLGWIPSMKSILIDTLVKQGYSISSNCSCVFSEWASLLKNAYTQNNLNPDQIRNFTIFESISAHSKFLQLLSSPFYVLFGSPTSGKHTPFTLKLQSAGLFLDAAITEEIVWRGLFQDVLLKRLPQMLLKVISPGKEKLLETKVAKIFRVVITAALFSIMHLPNKRVMSDAYVDRLQIPLTFLAGLLFGAIKESKLGLTGAVGAHLGLNTVGVAANFTQC